MRLPPSSSTLQCAGSTLTSAGPSGQPKHVSTLPSKALLCVTGPIAAPCHDGRNSLLTARQCRTTLQPCGNSKTATLKKHLHGCANCLSRSWWGKAGGATASHVAVQLRRHTWAGLSCHTSDTHWVAQAKHCAPSGSMGLHTPPQLSVKFEPAASANLGTSAYQQRLSWTLFCHSASSPTGDQNMWLPCQPPYADLLRP
jgi:hypothetical protein